MSMNRIPTETDYYSLGQVELRQKRSAGVIYNRNAWLCGDPGKSRPELLLIIFSYPTRCVKNKHKEFFEKQSQKTLTYFRTETLPIILSYARLRSAQNKISYFILKSHIYCMCSNLKISIIRYIAPL